MLAYTVVEINNKRYVLTLDIPEDALTTIGGSYVKVAETAQYRANKVMVVKIEDDNQNEFDSVSNYTVGEITEDPAFDTDLDKFNCEGITFFLSKEVADHYWATRPSDGTHKSWYPNGQQYEIRNFSNGKLHGICSCYYPNGQLLTDKTYENGYETGTHMAFHKTGNIMASTSYVNGVLNGLYEIWYENGTKRLATYYVDGKLHGECLRWFPNGKLCEKTNYSFGELISRQVYGEND